MLFGHEEKNDNEDSIMKRKDIISLPCGWKADLIGCRKEHIKHPGLGNEF